MPSISLMRETLFASREMKILVGDATEQIVAGRLEIRDATARFILHCLNGALSIVLLILGGTFAGLTLAFMGQDQVFLQVIAGSGTLKERQNATRVLKVLQRGRHWVLVSLLLGNVLTNETLPIVLDQDVKGGLFAVAASTILIVIFGEIIPQSVCAKHGLAIGAWSSRYVLWVMYGLFPIAYPVAKLLDRLLGLNHGLVFNRAGLKTLLGLHERMGLAASSERLSREEVALLSTILDLDARPISSMMIPVPKLFALGLNSLLDDTTRYNLLTSGYSGVPIHSHDHPTAFVGILPVKSLVALDFEEAVTVGQLSLDKLHVVPPDISCQHLLKLFRDRTVQMVLVTERGSMYGEPLGVVTARDMMHELIRDPIAFKGEEE
ncbi:uncharacterized protein L3040_003995 [Drepanopeziza brunnea f. sp. 'multigermtubi']|uniref:DUF21-domain-containing protein n=1 Tax=Marssonina brunnea f. sp. multigermtubi (strain MB_m1) TaxID=1072389 RepID=K1WBQ1_MARBU|nr:uncharacterized protein MBM_06996 [Drepanopeziza brunnea f. sp. 'multigermtubi' MB_m1]EKD14785.1 hypothetical protein MBM_06996 [Drepanopeziza brunnea f. sp. 'multigermtubi' MB_m1]KAJ5046767.1 hypothetical protein L3040_003995 [Drepanopeziza brunnea f. sp. 'multigermtubi']